MSVDCNKFYMYNVISGATTKHYKTMHAKYQ